MVCEPRARHTRARPGGAWNSRDARATLAAPMKLHLVPALALVLAAACQTPDYGRPLPEGAPALLKLGKGEKRPDFKASWGDRDELLPRDVAAAERWNLPIVLLVLIVVFGSLMGGVFIAQQYLQNVEGYSPLAAGASVLPAALVMVVVAPRSAKLIESIGSRDTLLVGYVCCLAGLLVMLFVWGEGTSYVWIAVPFVLVGAGVGLAGTPASRSLTGSVPVERVGMASGTADLQRDLGAAIMQSIMGALLTAGYASAVAAQLAAAPPEAQSQLTDDAVATLENSFSSVVVVAEKYPQYSDALLAGAKESFLSGQQWAFGAAAIAVALGAVLVWFCFPDREAERAALARYAVEDGSADAAI